MSILSLAPPSWSPSRTRYWCSCRCPPGNCDPLYTPCKQRTPVLWPRWSCKPSCKGTAVVLPWFCGTISGRVFQPRQLPVHKRENLIASIKHLLESIIQIPMPIIKGNVIWIYLPLPLVPSLYPYQASSINCDLTVGSSLVYWDSDSTGANRQAPNSVRAKSVISQPHD